MPTPLCSSKDPCSGKTSKMMYTVDLKFNTQLSQMLDCPPNYGSKTHQIKNMTVGCFSRILARHSVYVLQMFRIIPKWLLYRKTLTIFKSTSHQTFLPVAMLIMAQISTLWNNHRSWLRVKNCLISRNLCQTKMLSRLQSVSAKTRPSRVVSHSPPTALWESLLNLITSKISIRLSTRMKL